MNSACQLHGNAKSRELHAMLGLKLLLRHCPNGSYPLVILACFVLDGGKTIILQYYHVK